MKTMKPGLLESTRNQIVLADGAIGTELQRAGLEPGACCEAWNFEHPERVGAIHRAYVEAGSRLITTNSFRANRIALAQFGLDARVIEINQSAARIAREAAGARAWVMGSIGPLGAFIEPLGEITVETAFDAFLEQARALIAAGVDALIIETITATEELEIALRAAREARASVIIASMAFDKARDGYKTMMGVSIEQGVEAMTRAGADVIGCNCGARLAMNDYVEIVRRMRSYSDKPMIVEPNAGQAELIEGEIIYDQTAQTMAEKVEDLIRAGAGLIGGCCGTTPDFIRAFNAAAGLG